MSDRARLLEELTRLSEEAGLYDDEATPEEIIAAVKQVRKEMAEERATTDITVSTLHESHPCIDCYAAGEDAGAELEAQRIRENIRTRVMDLMSCNKDDNCKELGILIDSYIWEWIYD